MPGAAGHLLILLAFVSCIIATFAYVQAARTESRDWLGIARAAWGVVVVGILGASAILLALILTHQFQYAYVYQESSLDLPLHFLVSSFWAGQIGSFLLWTTFMAILGTAVLRYTSTRYGSWEAPVMSVIVVSQLFLVSMVVGLKLGPIQIGASPFQTLAEAFPEAPMLQVPGFVPADGSGLNDLLQNYWMAIHPPIVFAGFSMMVVPFAFAVSSLWKRRYTQWVQPALPWALVATAVLGVGIALGGYWAYETLSFGGYWAWDPVENSSLVPWLIGIAAVHSMIIQKKSGRGHKSALLLSVLTYMLVIYSTFLTRSGILGDVSVHSFVDLGMMNQLLVWILSVAGLGFGWYAVRYRDLPAPEQEPNLLSREFMTFCGAMVLAALSVVIAVGTSAPILGKLFREAPSTVPIEFYNKWTLPLSILLVFLAGLGQLFWWHRMSIENVNRVLLKPIVLSVASTLAILVFTPFVEETVRATAPGSSEIASVQAGFLGGLEQFWGMYGTGLLMLLLVFMAFFALYGNGAVLWRIGRGNARLAGGATAHVGFAIMILGIIASSGFSRPVAEGGGVQIGESRDNFVISRGETRAIRGYRVTYARQERTERNRPVYVLDFVDPRGRTFTVRPVVYKNDQEQWIQHPDHEIYPEKDVFVAVSPSAMFSSTTSEDPDANRGELTISRGDSTVIGNDAFTVKFVNYQTNLDPEMVPDSAEIAVAALLDVTNLNTGETRRLSPIYLIMQDRTQQYVQNRLGDWGLTVTFTGMNVDSGSINLFIEGVAITPEDWLVVQAYEKPLINVMWLGFMLLTFGFGLSIFRRFSDASRAARRTSL